MRLSYESYSNDEIVCILRDLSVGEKLNIKDLINDFKNTKKPCKIKQRVQDIIDSNNKTQNDVKIASDMERLKYFKRLKIIDKTIINEIGNFTTDYGKTKMKLRLLKTAFKQNMRHHIIDLYLQIISNQIDYTKKEKRLLSKVTEYMKNLKYKELQFKELSNQLAPLDFYNTYTIELDEWQKDAIKTIDSGGNVLISAPTSCGKTWLGLYPGLISKKLLFLVPTEALVFQVGSMFSKFIAQPTLVSDNILYLTDTNIVVGTPKAIEDKLPVLDVDFDIIIVDEIHNLGSLEEHHYYERLLKMFSDKQLLALSATIKNPHNLIKWLTEIGYSDINLVSYTTRFLNLQRQLFTNNKLVKVHPISCLNKSDITSEFLKKNIPMTPYDTINLYDSLNNTFPNEMKGLHISNIFPEHNKRLSLDDSRHYETILKDKLVYLNNHYPDKISDILDTYKLDYTMSEEVNLYNLFKEIKKKKLTPCIVFQENTVYCKEIFIKLVGYLEKLEELNYPYYYENLEFKQLQYDNSRKELIKFKKSIKLGNEITNKTLIIEEKMKDKEYELNRDFANKYKTHIKKQCQKILKSKTKEKIKNIQLTNLKKELADISSYSKLKYIDIFRKHREFSLNTDSPMTADKIREIKKSISKKLEIDVSYTNVFLQGLKRGIGIYTKHMPPIYNMIVQKLAQNGELGYVVADEQLALGINMPFRSSCILGYKDSKNFRKSNYLQMIGRAGRRGKDCEGHVIFVNVDWKNLMKSEMEEIQSEYNHYPTYKVINTFTDKYKNNTDKIFKFRMNKDDAVYENINEFFDCRILNSIVWKLRSYGVKPIKFCEDIDIIKDVPGDKTSGSINNIIDMLGAYFLTDEISIILKKIIKINKTTTIEDNKITHTAIKLIINIHNSLLNDEYKYRNFIYQLEHAFSTLKKILNNCNNLN